MNAELIKQIHDAPIKIALAIAGGGSEVIGELLRHGKGSATILDAAVPYCQSAFEKYIGGKPDKFVSEDAACSLAASAFKRATDLDNSDISKLGIGATVSLAKDHERVGREHRAFIAFHDDKVTSTYYLELHKERTREEEETLISEFILHELWFRLVKSNINRNFQDSTYDISSQDKIIRNHYFKKHFCDNAVLANCVDKSKNSSDLLLMPGSFDPIHAGHEKMAEYASKMCNGQKVDFEICIQNADKPPLSNKSINERIDGFYKNKKEFIGDLWLTKLPLFINKAHYFNGATFIVGHDTIERILDVKYYKSTEDFNNIFDVFNKQNIKWIIFPRIKKDGILSTEQEIEDLICKYKLNALKVPHKIYEEFKITNLSSSNIRKAVKSN